MAYNPPQGDELEFILTEYTPPQGDELVFQLQDTQTFSKIKSLGYYVIKTYPKTKSLTYSIKGYFSIQKTLKYCVKQTPSAKAKVLTYEILNVISAIEKGLIYKIFIVPSAITKGLIYKTTNELRYWVGGSGNWSDATNHWATSSGGAGHSSNLPTSSTDVCFDANSFSGASQIVTVNATAYCKNMDWTGATNTPTLRFPSASSKINVYGNITFIAAMSVTDAGSGAPSLTLEGAVTHLLVTNGLAIGSNTLIFSITSGDTLSLQDNLTAPGIVCGTASTGTLTTNNFNMTLALGVYAPLAGAATFNLGSSTINVSTVYGWRVSNSVIVTANTATINVSGTGAFAGGSTTAYNNINLNGTAHTVSGSFTANVFTRNGTSATTDSVTFTSGSTVTATTVAMIGYSTTSRLLVQSSLLGSPATITATNWTGTVNADFMDITATNAIDLSAITGLSGDCGGNTGITFTTAAAQTFSNASGNNWSTAANWTSRVPLPQDDVTAGGTGNTISVDMPRIGKSITFTGTPTVSLGNNISNYGSLTLVSGMTYTVSTYANYFYGRGNYTINTAGKTLYRIIIQAPGGTYTAASDIITSAQDINAIESSFNAAGYNITLGFFRRVLPIANTTLTLGSGTWTLFGTTGATTKWNVSSITGLTLVSTGSTIICTSSSANADTFAGGGLTYNNVTVQGAGNYALTITGSNTFNTFTVDRSQAAKTVTFTDLSTQIVSDFVCPVSGTTIVTLNGTSTAGWNLVKSDNIDIGLDYLNISYSAASPVDTWYAGENSVNVIGNSGWIFNYCVQKDLKYVIKTIPLAITKSLIYNIVSTPSAKTKELIYNVVSTPSAITKGLIYNVVSQESETKALTYSILTIPSAKTKSLRYDVLKSLGIIKGLIYKIISQSLDAKSLVYSMITTPSAKTKSLRYDIISVPSAIMKGLIYSIKAGVSNQKGLIYDIIYTPSAKTKCLIYDVILSKSSTKSLRYDIKKVLSKTKSLKYDIETTPSAITKPLRYCIVVTRIGGTYDQDDITYDDGQWSYDGLPTTILLTYSIKLNPDLISKTLKYTIILSKSLTKALKYEIKSQVLKTKSLTYNILSTPSGIAKGLVYCIKTTPTKKTKSLSYYILKTYSPIGKALVYNIISTTPAASKVLEYIIRNVGRINKGLIYNVKSPVSKTKQLKYALITTPSGITKTLGYYILITHSETKGLIYNVISTPSAKTKTLTYNILSSPAGIVKSLTYRIIKQESLTKTLTYRILTVPSAKTKSLKYDIKLYLSNTKVLRYDVITKTYKTKSLKYVLLYGVPHDVTKELIYRVSPSNSKTKSLTYNVLSVIPAIYKQLRYEIISPKSKTKILQYVVRIYPYSNVTSPYSNVTSPYSNSTNPYTPF
jgi:hypothetical protein